MILDKKFGESVEQYIARMYYVEKVKNGLTNKQVAENINLELGTNWQESYLRGIAKRYTEGFNDGRLSNQVKFDNNVMVINDIHAPFERLDLLDIISKHSHEIDTLVIGGDFLDCHSISSFPQIKETTLKDEVVYGYELLKKIRKILNRDQKIIMIMGNHEKRYQTNIEKLNAKDLQTFINPHILEMYTEGFTLYIDGKKKKYAPIEGLTYVPHWYVLIDDLIICHPTNFSVAKGKMLENVASFFINKGIDFSTIVLGHTHKMSCGIIERYAGKYVIENGCLCKAQNYADGSGKTSYTPQSYGYSIIRYNKGEGIDPNNCKTYYLPSNDYKEENIEDYTIEL